LTQTQFFSGLEIDTCPFANLPERNAHAMSA